VGFYFGARELHYLRSPAKALGRRGLLGRLLPGGGQTEPRPVMDNKALRDWMNEDARAS
jgi:hypothetical protein